MANEAIRVYKKEAREMLRDRRVRSSALLGPFLLVLMMMVMFGTLMKQAGGAANAKYYVVNATAGKPIFDALEMARAKQEKEKKKDGEKQAAIPRVTVVPIETMEQGRSLIDEGKATVVLEFPEDFAERLAKNQPVTVVEVYDSNEQRSQIAARVIDGAIDAFNQAAITRLLESKKLPAWMAAPVKTKTEDATHNKNASEILTSILPYLIVFWAFVGGMSSAADMVAGEKERNTLETLLITPVPRTQIVLGKFLALATICLMSSLSGLVAVFVSAYSHLPGTDALFANGTGLGPAAVGSIILVLLPTVALFASVLIAISTFAKNSREAQTYLSLASLAVAMPSLFSQFLGFTDFATARWINLIPVLNASAAVRSALIGKLDATSVLLTAATSAVLALISIYVAIRLFNREQVLLRI